MRRVPYRRRGLAAVLAVGVCALCASVAFADLKVVIQFRQPGSGQIELYAAAFKVRVAGTPPVRPRLKVTLPKSGPPHDYGLLAGERLASVHGNVATYVLLVEALRPLTSANAAQPLVGESLTVTPIANGGGQLHPQSQELTIDNGTEQERAKFDSVLVHVGVTDFSASSFAVRAFDDGHAFGWEQRVVEWNKTWDISWTAVSKPTASDTALIDEIQALVHEHFAGGLPAATPPCSAQASAGNATAGAAGTLTCTKGVSSFTLTAPPGEAFVFVAGQNGSTPGSTPFTCPKGSASSSTATCTPGGGVAAGVPIKLDFGTSPQQKTGDKFQLTITLADGSTTTITVTLT